ncbi:hypothetical protein BGZ54_003327 [Gamsiella multidivaricata]|nr:hypothetical protein BGZ54_003327 [Gamsiella multidivaricata]
MDTSSLVSLDTLSDTSCTTSCGGAPPSTISLPHDSPFDPSGQGYLFSTASGSHNGSIHANISTTTLVNPDPADLHTVHSSKSPSPELLSSASPVSSKKPSPVDGPSPFDNNNNNSNNNNNNNNSSNDNSNNHNSNNYNYINSAQGECDEGDGTLEAPDGGWKAWSVVLGSVLIQTFAFAPTEFIFGVFVQEYLESFPKASPSAVALIGTTGTCVTYLMGMVAGTLAGRWGYRATAFVGTLVMTVALILASFATQIWHLYLSQGILFGTGASLVYFSAIAAPTYWFKKKRGLALGIGASGAGLGGFYLAPLTQYLAGHVGIHWTLRVLAMYSLVVCGIASVLLFEREKPERRQKLLMKDLKNAHPKKIGSSFTMPAYSKDTVFVMLALFQLCLSLAYLTPVYFMELYSTHIGNSKQAGAAINAWFNAASFVSRIASGILADLVPPQWVLMGCIWVIVFAVLILWTFAKTFLLFLLFAVLYGAAFSGVSTVTPVIIADYYGHAQVARVLGIVYTASSPALLGGSFISGNLLEMTKTEVNFLPVIMSAGGMFALSAIFATAWVVLMAQRSIAPRPRDPAPTPTRRTSIEV